MKGSSARGSDGRTRGAAARTAAVALSVTLAIQIYTAVAATATAVLARNRARSRHRTQARRCLRRRPLCGLDGREPCLGMFIQRHGPIRVSQVCVLLCAAGALLLSVGSTLPGGAVLALAVAPLIIGVGYGPITPASSQILARTAHPSRMALTFSIKQTGVPAGAALAGAALPILALQFGWHAAFGLVAVLGVAVALTGQITRAARAERTRATCRRSPASSRSSAAAQRAGRTREWPLSTRHSGLPASFMVVYLTDRSASRSWPPVSC
jgi:MFS family permease